MKNLGNHWYQVAEVWLVIVLLLATMVGSLALVVTAFEHRDELHQTGPVIASPLPPTTAAQPADRATP
jgi:hypothetical protein